MIQLVLTYIIVGASVGITLYNLYAQLFAQGEENTCGKKCAGCSSIAQKSIKKNISVNRLS